MERPKLEFKEEHAAGSGLYIRVDEVLYTGRSDYQDIFIFRNEFWGTVFVLDGLVMMTERDEYFYHEALVHPPMVFAERTDRVLLIGGGDGGSVREILKYSPREVEVAEIDAKVVEVARRFLPTGKYLDAPNVKVDITDGARKVKVSRGYDVIVVDSTDPVGPAKVLFTREFLGDVREALSDGGVVGMQVGSPMFYGEQVRETYAVLGELFEDVRFYVSFTPTYPSGMWGFLLASKGELKFRREVKGDNRLLHTEDDIRALLSLGRGYLRVI
ncbi:MAG: polyamine aminopropyltransferase [Thermotogae bacterium]|nr:polyamine aminopropyltransferase [Thermotogota bacterium]